MIHYPECNLGCEADSHMLLPDRYAEKAHTGKRGYDTKKAARRAAGMTSATFGGEPKVAYRCFICGRFHVGRDPR